MALSLNVSTVDANRIAPFFDRGHRALCYRLDLVAIQFGFGAIDQRHQRR